jgi:hypothetical protein
MAFEGGGRRWIPRSSHGMTIFSPELQDLNPVKYLTFVFNELPSCKVLADYEALLPYAICDEKLKISK